MKFHASIPTQFGLLCTLLLGAGFAQQAQAAQYIKSYPVNGRANVHVLAENGAVRVTTSDASTVEFIVTYDQSIWPSQTPIRSRQDGTVVELTAIAGSHTWWGWNVFGSSPVSIEVRMPKNADLKIDTTNGAISLDAINGAVNVRTSNGAISAMGLDCRCALATSNGRVEVSGRFESLAIFSSNAGVSARAASGSRMDSQWSIRTTNAGVDLSLPRDFNADLAAGTTNGGIRLSMPIALQGQQYGQHLRGTLGSGGPELSVHTTNGGVRIDES